jgi:hypothetical protein
MSDTMEGPAIESAIAPTVIVGRVSRFNVIEPGDELGEPGDKGWSE